MATPVSPADDTKQPAAVNSAGMMASASHSLVTEAVATDNTPNPARNAQRGDDAIAAAAANDVPAASASIAGSGVTPAAESVPADGATAAAAAASVSAAQPVVMSASPVGEVAAPLSPTNTIPIIIDSPVPASRASLPPPAAAVNGGFADAKNDAATAAAAATSIKDSKSKKPKHIPPVPEKNPADALTGSGWWSYLSWRWVNPLFRAGAVRPLESLDLWELPETESAQHLTNQLHTLWDQELSSNPLTPSLTKVYRQAFGRTMAIHGIMGLFESCARIAAVLFIGELIMYFADFRRAYNAGLETPSIGRGLGWCAAFCVTNGFLVPFHHVFFWHGYRFGMRLKQATIGLIYRKAIQLSNGALLSTTGGQVANLISNDVYRFEKFALYWPFFLLGPFEAAVSLYILWRQVGVASLSGLLVLLCFIPFQAWFGRLFGKLRQKSSLITDERVKLMTEIISGMRIMKMFAWEPSYAERVEGVRAAETEQLQAAGRLKGANMGISFGASPVICLATFLTYFYSSDIVDFTADRIFVTLSLFGLIRITMTLFFPFAVEGTSEIRVSLKRIQAFFVLDNFQRLNVTRDAASAGATAAAILSANSNNVTSVSKEHAQAVAKRRLNFLSESLSKEDYQKPFPDHMENPHVTLRSIHAWWSRQGQPLDAYSVHASPALHPSSQVNGMVATAHIPSMGTSVAPSGGVIPLPTVPDHIAAFPPLRPLILPDHRLPLPGIAGSLPSTPHDPIAPAKSRAPGPPSLRYSSPLPPPPPPPSAPAPVPKGYDVQPSSNVPSQPSMGTFVDLSGDKKTIPPPTPSQIHHSAGNSPTGKGTRKDLPTLVDINMDVRAGQLCAIVGPVGAGKSSILMTILSELTPNRGSISVHGSTAYAAQQPWIMSGTVKSNVLMGLPYEEERFQRAVKACALEKDIVGFSDGIMTVIGERGITLSGGQRARVALARAVYHDADIYLLDDPLSAVDPGVARHLFDHCICGALRDKVVILVTHQLQFVERATKIMVLTSHGTVAGFGTFQELQQRGLNFAEIIAAMQDDHIKEEETKAEVKPTPSLATSPNVTAANKDKKEAAGPKAEARSEGAVGLSTYTTYFKAGGGWFGVFLTSILLLVAPTALIMTDWWLANWLNLAESNRKKDENAIVYGCLVAFTLIVCMLRAMLLYHRLLRASQYLHTIMLRRVVRVPIAFFDNNPVGRILNRFSNDIGMMDDALPFVITDCIGNVSQCIGVVILVCAINPYVLIPLVPLAVASVYYRSYYISTSREVKRLESTSRSPVHSDFASSLDGLATIRAYQSEPYFIREFMKHQDDNGRGFFAFLVTSRWIGVRLDTVSVMFIIAVTFFLVIVRDSISPSLVGLSLTYALNLMGSFQWAVRTTTEVENQMIAVERVIQYSNLPMEPSLTTLPPHTPPPNDWPSAGEIVAKDLTLKYLEEGPVVIKGISFKVHSRDKIGIVGRTGSGKTSLMSCLFRLVEWGGDIIIDGVAIKNIGLHELRSKLSVIPQEPTLFSGTIRKNLDPFGQCSDSQLWQALEQVQMQTPIRQLPLGLSAPLSEGGSNMSVGQRQLLCLARAITRRSRLLVMDEATANVDLDTDAIIQRTIRSHFRDCTVVVIAHRLNTIMDSDRVMVLDHGHMLEFDVPHRLLCNANGALSRMVSETGSGMSRELRRMAAAKFQTLDPTRGGPLPNEIVTIIPSNGIGSSNEDLVSYTSIAANDATIAAPPPAIAPSTSST